MSIYVGTSGWNYPTGRGAWNGLFYPPAITGKRRSGTGRAKFDALAYYAALVIFWLNWSLLYLVGRTHWLLAVLAFSILIAFIVIGIFLFRIRERFDTVDVHVLDQHRGERQ